MTTKLEAKIIESLLMAKFLADRTLSDKCNAVTNEILGVTPPEQSKVDTGITYDMYRVISSMVAVRLMANDRSVPLFSADDIDEAFANFSKNHILSTDQDSLEALELDYILKTSLKGLLVDDPYELYWRLINATVTLLDDGLLQSDETLSGESYDEVIRRSCTREEYVTRNEGSIALLAVPEKLITDGINPVLDVLCEGNLDLRAEMEQIFRDAIEKEVLPKFMKLESALRIVMMEEVQRVYGK